MGILASRVKRRNGETLVSSLPVLVIFIQHGSLFNYLIVLMVSLPQSINIGCLVIVNLWILFGLRSSPTDFLLSTIWNAIEQNTSQLSARCLNTLMCWYLRLA